MAGGNFNKFRKTSGYPYRKGTYIKSSSLGKRSSGNLKAAFEQRDQSEVVLNCNNTVSCRIPKRVDGGFEKDFNVAAVNVFDALYHSEFFGNYAPMYDQVKIDKVKAKITSLQYPTTPGTTNNNLSVVTAIDRNGLDGNQLVERISNEQVCIGTSIGKAISTYSSALTKNLSYGSTFEIIRYITPFTVQEKGQYISTDSLKQWYRNYSVNGEIGSNRYVICDQNTKANDRYYKNCVSNNPCYLEKDAALPFKPTFLIGAIGLDALNGDCIFNVELDVCCTFRGLRKSQTIDSDNPTNIYKTIKVTRKDKKNNGKGKKGRGFRDDDDNDDRVYDEVLYIEENNEERVIPVSNNIKEIVIHEDIEVNKELEQEIVVDLDGCDCGSDCNCVDKDDMDTDENEEIYVDPNENDIIWNKVYEIYDPDYKLIDKATVNLVVKKIKLAFIGLGDELITSAREFRKLLNESEVVIKDRDIVAYGIRDKNARENYFKKVFVKIESFIKVSAEGVYKVNNEGNYILINSSGVSCVHLNEQQLVSMKEGDMYYRLNVEIPDTDLKFGFVIDQNDEVVLSSPILPDIELGHISNGSDIIYYGGKILYNIGKVCNKVWCWFTNKKVEDEDEDDMQLIEPVPEPEPLDWDNWLRNVV